MMAKNAGITIPNIRIEGIGEKDIFMIERFDRSYDLTKKAYTRNGFVSGLSFLGKDEGERGFGYPDFAEALRVAGDFRGVAELFNAWCLILLFETLMIMLEITDLFLIMMILDYRQPTILRQCNHNSVYLRFLI